MEAYGGAKLFENKGDTGDRGRSRSDCGEPDEPDAGDENTVLARLATVGAGEESRFSATTGNLSAWTDESSTSRGLAAGVTAADLLFREGGRGRGRDLLDEASRLDSVGRPF